ncbi:type VII secretion target [Nocardia sp. NPDC052566]|uniref:type VII secretion target n=1 Tax=Nocardia sp. NPDC052566 TaxID=3364330 RepID=UPI0037C6745D
MTDFHVVPQALRTQANEIINTAGHYNLAANYVGDHRMPPLTLGIFGKDVASIFNDVATNVHDKLDKGKKSIQSAGEGISTCATNYENVDAQYYREFGYIDEMLGY